MSDMTVTINEETDFIILKVRGFLDASNTGILGRALEKVLFKINKIIIDANDIGSIMTYGWWIVVAYLNIAREQNGDIVIARMNNKIEKVFRIMGFDKTIKAFSTIIDGARSFKNN